MRLRTIEDQISFADWFGSRCLLTVVVLAAIVFPGCKHGADARPLDQAGIGVSSIQELRELNINDSEVTELVKVKKAGVSDPSCVELVRMARVRNQPFAARSCRKGRDR